MSLVALTAFKTSASVPATVGHISAERCTRREYFRSVQHSGVFVKRADRVKYTYTCTCGWFMFWHGTKMLNMVRAELICHIGECRWETSETATASARGTWNSFYAAVDAATNSL